MFSANFEWSHMTFDGKSYRLQAYHNVKTNLLGEQKFFKHVSNTRRHLNILKCEKYNEESNT